MITDVDRKIAVARARKIFQRMPGCDRCRQSGDFSKPCAKCDEELYYFVWAVWGVRIPRTRVCEDHCSPFEAFADAYFARSATTIWKASRGFGGKSNALSLLGNQEVVALECEVSILGGSGAQSLRVKEHMGEHWGAPNAPSHMITKTTQFETHLSNNAMVRALMASQTSVRGGHPARMRLDEIDEMDILIIEAAQGCTMRKTVPNANGGVDVLVETQTVMSSTHQYPDKGMTYALRRAVESDWPIYQWCWKETSNPIDGWLTMEEVERKRTEITLRMWESEYDLQEPSFVGRAIDTDKVEEAFSKALGEYEGFDGERIKTKGYEPLVLETNSKKWPYITAVDWAKTRDWTIVATFDKSTFPYTCVEFQRFARIPWPTMVAKAEAQWRKWGGKFTHDATGVGGVVDDFLEGDRTAIIPVILSGGRAREDMINEYISAIEHGDIKWPRIAYAYDEHKYVTNDDLFTSSGHVPDTFIVGMLAWATRPKKRRVRMVAPEGIEKRSDWLR